MEQSLVSRPPRKVDMVVAGEHLRCRLHCEQPPLIKDRRYHLRVYQSCFVARDLVDWLIEHLEANDRNAAVECMEILLCNGFVHHGKQYIYIYIYMYVCMCMYVCVCEQNKLCS